MRAPSNLQASLHAAIADLRDLARSDTRLYRLALRASLWLLPVMLGIVLLGFEMGPVPGRDCTGNVMGVDFTQVWAAGQAALRGAAAEPYDLPRHLQNLREAFGPECRFAWHYPPVFLLPAAAVAALPPPSAFLAWTLAGTALFALALRFAGGRAAIIIGLAHPLVFCNLAYGQNGLFTAGLLTLGALLVDRRPLVAGLCFGLVAYKPQLAALPPLLLLATGRWRCLGACIGTVLALCLAALLAFGTAPWLGFLGTLGETDRIILRQAAAGLDLNASAYGAVRLAGGPFALAWTVQIAASLGALALAWRVWTTCPDPLLRAATLLAAAPMLSPYVPVYDLAPLVPATVLLVVAARQAGGLRACERWLLVAAPLTAALRTGAEATGICFGLIFALATLACLAARTLPQPEPRGLGALP
ncbi:hypothetical protein GCM10007886_16900 [Methylobacterium gregans]|uniref:DUF2029 domain-containing protein n=1 Tax=Methylobacterium gregans TaxID=374424 RepID=A0AA37M9A4_9HYPH|nr:glycosyltransferase family 87 protein [Methylobacterium gregans]MDQ0523273.1 hypothetical protein [Methylobacterium gregans]GJD77252.1 hypothetical protein NBEOAGPD_0455 [Methylobacterium gregans]GLS53507.1 hypothetical protein GCM10007886_16900 [Methylobacterium gregans]